MSNQQLTPRLKNEPKMSGRSLGSYEPPMSGRGLDRPPVTSSSSQLIRMEKLQQQTQAIKEKSKTWEEQKGGEVTDCQILSHLLLDKINVLFVGLPVAVLAIFLDWGEGAIFTACFVGLIPLAKLLGDATENLAENLNQTIGGLLNATFGNAVEMIITVSALRDCKFEIVKNSLLGSVLSNLLLVLGMAFFVGGLRYQEQRFPGAAALINVTMLFVGVMSLSLPTVFGEMAKGKENILPMSQVSAIFVGIGYIAYLVFQLKTHVELFEDEDDEEDGTTTAASSPAKREKSKEALVAQEEHAALSVPWALGLLMICTIVVSVLSERMVKSIDGLVKEWHIPEGFVGVILLPIVGNACEHASAVRMAYSNKVATAIAIAVGSSTQIALLVMPFSVLCAWGMGKPMDLDLHPAGLVVLFLSVLVVFSIVMDGKSHWFEGFMLVLCYCLVAVLYWFSAPVKEVTSCADLFG